jgi:hypothetical protein
MFLLSISTQGTENGFVWLADTRYTQLTRFSLHVEVIYTLYLLTCPASERGARSYPANEDATIPRLYSVTKNTLGNAEELFAVCTVALSWCKKDVVVLVFTNLVSQFVWRHYEATTTLLVGSVCTRTTYVARVATVFCCVPGL